MKHAAVWLLVMVTCFGSCQLYAAPSKAVTKAGRAIGYLINQAIRHNWPRWVVWLLVAVGLLGFVGWIAGWFDDKK